MQLLTDATFTRDGKTVSDQQIFETIFSVIERAQKFLILDMFLYNGDYAPNQSYPPLSHRLTQALIHRKKQSPNLPILLITDPINTFYNSCPRDHFTRLKAAGIEVVETNLDALPDSNPAYSLLYRNLLDKLPEGRAVLPNVLHPTGPKMSLGAYTRLFNFKANHRKVILNETEAVVSSANPHDASAPNSNLGFHVTGPVMTKIFESEKAVYDLSSTGTFFTNLPSPRSDAAAPSSKIGQEDAGQGGDTAALLTEAGIRDAVLNLIGSARTGEKITCGMFYLADRQVITALKVAAQRRISVQVILDKNKDAFGRSKTGLPNLSVAEELATAGAHVRWADTRGEQYHPKYLALTGAQSLKIIAGSGNFTRRNIGGYNLETSLLITSSCPELIKQYTGYWERQWHNTGGIYTQSLSDYKQPTRWQHLAYRLQEKSGLGTF